MRGQRRNNGDEQEQTEEKKLHYMKTTFYLCRILLEAIFLIAKSVSSVSLGSKLYHMSVSLKLTQKIVRS